MEAEQKLFFVWRLWILAGFDIEVVILLAQIALLAINIVVLLRVTRILSNAKQ